MCLILGDNIFYGPGLPTILREAVKLTRGGLIFGYPVRDPERYGVVEFDADRRVIGIEEKPRKPKSNYAVPGFISTTTTWSTWPRRSDPPRGASSRSPM